MYNPFETMQADELNPDEYNAYLDHFKVNEIPDKIKTRCVKCGALVTGFELDINDGRCPCCDSILVEKDIPI